jgi:hypothetical protein
VQELELGAQLAPGEEAAVQRALRSLRSLAGGELQVDKALRVQVGAGAGAGAGGLAALVLC